MKYNTTHRSINTVLFGILTAGFIALTVFYTFIWAPNSVNDAYMAAEDIAVNGKSFAFNANLGTLFFALAIVSGFGLFYSVKSLMNAKNDQLVVDSFLCYVAIGYVAAIFFALNALWLNQQIGAAEKTFWIVLCVIGIIIALIAANVPVMKILEDDKTNRLSVVVSFAFFAVAFSTFVNFGYTAIVVGGSNEHFGLLKGYLATGTIISIVAALLAMAGTVLYQEVNKGKKLLVCANASTYLSVAVFGALPLWSGINELVQYNDNKVKSFVSLVNLTNTFAGEDYCVLAIVTGSLLILAGLGLVIYAVVANKKEN